LRKKKDKQLTDFITLKNV